MKCSNCGAEIGNNRYCQYCGTQISVEMMKKQEQLNKSGCPRCNSTNVQFRRENQGEIRGKNTKQIVHATVGFCKDCGFTWYPNIPYKEPQKKRKTWLWVLGWIFIFPVPLTLILLRKKNLNPALKYGIIALGWLIYIVLFFNGLLNNGKEEIKGDKNSASESIIDYESETEKKDEIFVLQSFYDDFTNNGSYDNLTDIVDKYGLYKDSRKNGIGDEYFKIAYTKELAKVTSNTDLETEGNYIVIEFDLLNNKSITSIQFHKKSE